MKISHMIYDIIVIYYFNKDNAYHSSIRTCLRGTLGIVSQKASNYYFFGKHKGIDDKAIEILLEQLVINKLIDPIWNGKRNYYIPADSEQAIKRYEWILRQNMSLKYIVGENTVNV